MSVDLSNAAAVLAEKERREQLLAQGRRSFGGTAPGAPTAVAPRLERARAPIALVRTNPAYTERQAGRMNKTEARYAAHLEQRRLADEILRWDFEPMTLHLAPGVSWKPDFRVIFVDGLLELHEVKGRAKDGRYYATEKARLKLRLAAELHPFRIRVVWPLAGGGWGEEIRGSAAEPA